MKFKTIATIALGGLKADRMEMENGNQGGRLEINLRKMTNLEFESYTKELQTLILQAKTGNTDLLQVTN